MEKKNELARVDIIKREDLPTSIPERQRDAIYKMALVVARSPEIALCTAVSIRNSIIDAVNLGLSPHPALGQAYIYPYKGVATLHIGYRGLIQIAATAGWIIRAELVHMTDIFNVKDENGQMDVYHAVSSPFADRGEVIGGFAVAYHKDNPNRPVYEIMSNDDFDKAKAKSRGKGNVGTSQVWDDWRGEMSKKTMIRRLWKKLPLSLEMTNAEINIHANDDEQPTMTINEPAITTTAVVVKSEPAQSSADAEPETVEVIEPEVVEPTDKEKELFISQFKLATVSKMNQTSLKKAGCEFIENTIFIGTADLNMIYNYLQEKTNNK